MVAVAAGELAHGLAGFEVADADGAALALVVLAHSRRRQQRVELLLGNPLRLGRGGRAATKGDEHDRRLVRGVIAEELDALAILELGARGDVQLGHGEDEAQPVQPGVQRVELQALLVAACSQLRGKKGGQEGGRHEGQETERPVGPARRRSHQIGYSVVRVRKGARAEVVRCSMHTG